MVEDKTKIVIELMNKPEQIRNIGIAAHIDHGKTTLTDNLLAGAGMISKELAGKQLYTDFDKQEQERGITIYSANVSMVHTFKGKKYLINLIDTPGHVDFGGDVTRAMRAVDGAVVVVCAVEGVMPQTETVLRQALKERVKPVLFINKVDRLIKELKLTPEMMQERFMKIISEVNKLIKKYAEEEFSEQWYVSVEDGSVAFGSAYRNWAISFPYMKDKGITFKDIIDYCSSDKDKDLAEKAPLHEVVLDMIIEHLPNPKIAQKYRIPKIWLGDVKSVEGKNMAEMNPDGVLAGIITKVIPDPHAGIVSTARIFSGTIKKGQEVYLVAQHKTKRVQQVALYKGPHRIPIESVPAGNIVAIIGLDDAFSGETICNIDKIIKPFESIKHLFEPVVTKSIESEDPRDLTKIIEFLKRVAREDPTLKVEINEETGEYLVSGLGELHINAKIERPLKDSGVGIKVSPPIVVYRETIRKSSEIVEGKSSNRHNKFYLSIEPLEDGVYEALVNEKIPLDVRKQGKEIAKLLEKYGMKRDEAKKVWDIYKKNLLIDLTKGIQHLGETKEMIIQAFREIVDQGPLAQEECSKIKVKLHDAKLHEDAIHRGPAQVIPAVKFAIGECFKQADPTLLEPLQIIRIDVPEEVINEAMSQVQSRRGQILETNVEHGVATIKAKLPVAEMFGFEASLKSATGGRGFYSLIDIVFERIPEELKDRTISSIRARKGLE